MSQIYALFRKLHLASIAYNHLVEVVEKSLCYWTWALRMPEKSFVRNTAMISEGETLENTGSPAPTS